MDTTTTPRSRPHLKFANRVYTSSPQGSTKRFSSPQLGSSRKLLNRDDLPPSNLSHSTIAAAGNIFRSSTLSNGSSHRFEPNLPPSTMKKVFAPGSTPDAKRTFREPVARPTPRGLLAKSTSQDLFPMRIPSPPAELTGEALAKKVPQDSELRGSVYADQYLSHLCPNDFDDLQRRQFFCVLDLRRLKYAANEIFAKKDWKLNVTNFAKEFEKSRSLIMLRYGLYEFKNVRPSDEVLRKWKESHGLPVDEDGSAPTPTKLPTAKPTTSMKRKAEDDLAPKDTALSTLSPNKNKRRAVEKEGGLSDAVPASIKNKRKAPAGHEQDENQPSKLLRTAPPSGTKALFEKIAARAASSSNATPSKAPSTPATASTPALGSAIASTTPRTAVFGTTLTPNVFAPSSKASVSSLHRSVLDGSKPAAAPGNIFGYLSDASSAKNSGVDADGESESDSEPETEPQETAQSYEPSVVASGESGPPSSQLGSGGRLLFESKTPHFASGVETGPSSTSSDGRESTPGRSLFDRITKGTDGQPLRKMQEEEESGIITAVKEPATETSTETQPENAAPANNTWSASTPIKFAPSDGKSVFQSMPKMATSSIFAPKLNLSSSSALAPPTQEQTAAEPSKPHQGTGEPDKSGGESDKENISQPNAESQPVASPSVSRPLFASTTTATATAPSEPSKDAEEKTGTSTNPPNSKSLSLEANQPRPESAEPVSFMPRLPGTSLSQASSIFGSTSHPPLGSGSTLFGAKKVDPDASSTGLPPTPSSAFGNAGRVVGAPSLSSSGTAPLFGTPAGTQANPVKPPTFGNAQAASGGLFGSSSASSSTANAKPIFNFGAPAPVAGSAAEKTPTADHRPTFGGTTNIALEGSPMKQDGPSPSKRGFDNDAMQQDAPNASKKLFAGNDTGAANLSFTFGTQQPTPPTSFTTFTPSAQPNTSFGSVSTAGNSFTFTAGNSQSITNPFASGNNSSQPVAATPGGPGLFGSAGTSLLDTQQGSGGFIFGAGNANPAPSGPPSNNPFAFSGSVGNKGPVTSGERRKLVPASLRNRVNRGNSPAPASMQQNNFAAFGNNASAAPPSISFTSASPQPAQAPPQSAPSFAFGAKAGPPASSIFSNLQLPASGTSTTGTNSPFNFGGASSLATTPATGTPEPLTDPEARGGSSVADVEDGGAAQAQINLTEGGPGEEDETILHEVKARVMKFSPPGRNSDSEEGGKNKSPWSLQGVGPLRLLKHKTTGAVRVLLRREPTGQVALNRAVLPTMEYKAKEKYVTLTTSNDDGSGLETWMLQVKTNDMAKTLAAALESNKAATKA